MSVAPNADLQCRVLRVVVVEDEEPQRRQLVAWLGAEPDVALAGEFGDGVSAVSGIDEAQPDLVLLDVAMPLLSGLEVLRRISWKPEVVFTTAYRDHAVAAFELGAVDYLLKPFRRERLSEAIARVRTRLAEPTGARNAEGTAAGGDTEEVHDLPSLVERLVTVRNASQPLERLFVRDRGAIVPVPIADVERIEADGDYSAVFTATRRFLVAVPLHALHKRIGRDDFVRVHRGHVVNLARVAKIVPADDGRLRVEMRATGAVLASRSGSQALRQLVE